MWIIHEIFRVDFHYAFFIRIDQLKRKCSLILWASISNIKRDQQQNWRKLWRLLLNDRPVITTNSSFSLRHDIISIQYIGTSHSPTTLFILLLVYRIGWKCDALKHENTRSYLPVSFCHKLHQNTYCRFIIIWFVVSTHQNIHALYWKIEEIVYKSLNIKLKTEIYIEKKTT